MTFNNPSFPGEDTADTNLTSGIPDSSSTNALYIKQGGHIGDPPAAPFQILFTTPVTMVGFDYGSSPESFLKIDAYSSDNVLLETLTYIGDPTWLGLGGFAGIDESTDIARVDVSYHPNYDPARTFNFSIADLRFADNCVPEPATPALVAIGICTIVLGRRKLLVSRV